MHLNKWGPFNWKIGCQSNQHTATCITLWLNQRYVSFFRLTSQSFVKTDFIMSPDLTESPLYFQFELLIIAFKEITSLAVITVEEVRSFKGMLKPTKLNRGRILTLCGISHPWKSCKEKSQIVRKLIKWNGCGLQLQDLLCNTWSDFFCWETGFKAESSCSSSYDSSCEVFGCSIYLLEPRIRLYHVYQFRSVVINYLTHQ